MKKICRLVLAVYLMSVTSPLLAVVIEGNTPSGKFKSVFVTEDGRLPIEISTGAVQNVRVTTGSITAFQGGAPWAVTTSVGVSVETKPSTTSLTTTGLFSCTGVASIAYPADAARRAGVLCNNDLTVNIYLGDGSGQNMLIPPGGCYSPDNPTAHIGALLCRSTATAAGSYIYHK